jgi:putative FmdB family regulatory protein
MPVYEYTCRICGNRFEVLTAAADKDKVRCPVCRGKDLGEVYGSTQSPKKESCSTKRFNFG